MNYNFKKTPSFLWIFFFLIISSCFPVLAEMDSLGSSEMDVLGLGGMDDLGAPPQEPVKEVKKLYDPDGRLVYEGEVINKNVKHGKGTYYFKNGAKCYGTFENDILNGPGVYFFVNGWRYEGSLMNNGASGDGFLYAPDGKKYQALVQNLSIKKGEEIVALSKTATPDGRFPLQNQPAASSQPPQRTIEDPFGYRVIAYGYGKHNLILQNDGSVWAWGSNTYAQLGDGTSTIRITPNRVKDTKDPSGYLTGVTALTRNEKGCIALKKDGSVWEWGAGAAGSREWNWSLHNHAIQITAQEDPKGYLSDITAVAAGIAHAVALRKDGTLWTWGNGTLGALGYKADFNEEAHQVPNIEDVTAIAAAADLTAVLKKDQTVWICGHIGGIMDDLNYQDIRPVMDSTDPTGMLRNVTRIFGCYDTFLFLKNDGSLWALNRQTNSNHVCFKVNDASDPTGWLTNVRDVALIGNRWDGKFVILKNDGLVFSLSIARDGVFGAAVEIIPGLEQIVQIAGGAGSGIALKSDGSLWTWGKNDEGQLGNGKKMDSNTPVQVKNLIVKPKGAVNNQLELTEGETGVKVIVTPDNQPTAELLNLPTQYFIATNKVWTFSANAPLAANSINGDNIYISDVAGAKIPAVVTPGADGKSFRVVAKSSYIPNRIYFLYLRGLAADGYKMNYTARLAFTITDPGAFIGSGAGNSSGNQENGGYAAKSGDCIYYANPADGDKLYKIKTDNTGNIKLSGDSVAFINIVANWVFYKNMGDGKIYKITVDGKNRTKLNDDKVDYVTVTNGWVFYIGMNSAHPKEALFRTDLNGANRKLLIETNGYNLMANNGWLYYRTSEYNMATKFNIIRLHKIKFDGTNHGYVANQVMWMNAVGDWLYYIVFRSDAIVSCSPDDTLRRSLESGAAKLINASGDWIYYLNESDGNALYRIKIDGSGKVRIGDRVPGTIEYLCVVGDWIYCNQGKLKIDGSQFLAY